MYRGEKLILDVYKALRANDPLWQRSLLVVTYDEHGGFYDHVSPPHTAVKPDNFPVYPPVSPVGRFDFTQFGVRVPTILVSPWLDQGVISDVFDHTSILKFVSNQWGLGNYLGNRVASPATNTFAKYLRKTPRQVRKPPAIHVPDFLPPPSDEELSDYQEELIELGQVLATRLEDPEMRLALLKNLPDPTPVDRKRRSAPTFSRRIG
jgi:phospholipase C